MKSKMTLLIALSVFLSAATQAQTQCQTQWQSTFQVATNELQWHSMLSAGSKAEAPQIVDTTPTAKLGSWIEVRQGKDRTDVRLVSAETTQQVVFNADCKVIAQSEFPRMTVSEGDDFTDSKLAKLLGKKSKGVIYLWSPRMPYSLVGIAEVKKFAKEKGLELTYVLDSHVSVEEAKPFLAEYQLPKSATQHFESLELFYRGMGIHFPTIQLYQKGKLTGSVLHGFHEAALYTRFQNEVAKTLLKKEANSPLESPLFSKTARLMPPRSIEKIGETVYGQTIDYWHRPVFNTPWVTYTDIGGGDSPKIFNLETAKTITMPAGVDPVPTQDARYIILPTSRYVGRGQSCFFETSEIIKKGTAAKSFYCDPEIKADYLFVGQLSDSPTESVYRLAGHGSTAGSIRYRDYKVVHAKGGKDPVATPLTAYVNVCDNPEDNSWSVALPMISPDGKEIAIETDKRSLNTKIFTLDPSEPKGCRLTLSLNAHIAKLAFDPTPHSQRVTFYAPSYQSLPPSEVPADPAAPAPKPSDEMYYQAFILDRATLEIIPITPNNQTLKTHSFPAFLANGDVIYQNVNPADKTKNSFITVRVK